MGSPFDLKARRHSIYPLGSHPVVPVVPKVTRGSMVLVVFRHMNLRNASKYHSDLEKIKLFGYYGKTDLY